ncbi:kinase-like domain-containing protein [Mariannaea sp. PMI_226]|nr:kinase-like domain-containing protein [Mariannaea sp. PMI_226]
MTSSSSLSVALNGSENSDGPGSFEHVGKGKNPRTEASTIFDGGDAKQLELSAPNRDDADKTSRRLEDDHLLCHTGDSFSPQLSRPTEIELPSEIELNRQIRAGMVESDSFIQKETKFLPVGTLDELVNKKRIILELEGLKLKPTDIETTADEIWGISTFDATNQKKPMKTTRRKLFIILVMLNKMNAIMDFISEGIYDSDLPFYQPQGAGETLLRRKDEHGKFIDVQSLATWNSSEHDSFYNYQWMMSAPFWNMSTEINPTIQNETSGARNSHDGGFSFVHKVAIHADHHNLHDPIPKTSQYRLFAVKRLNSEVEQIFDKERNNLKRLVGHNHPHLIRVLVTFQHGTNYHLIFPWANENLLSYWKKRSPRHHEQAVDHNAVVWLAKQFHGLARAIALIHYCTVDIEKSPELAPYQDKVIGRHGDLKPENILWFDDGDRGIFQITDFGLADFHREVSRMQRASERGGTETYIAPECVSEMVTESSDLWSFGCVLLEFITWWLSGWEGVDRFSEARAGDTDPSRWGSRYTSDRFFQSQVRQSGNTNAINQITLKASVKKKDLLQVNSKNRRTAKQCSANFEEIYKTCVKEPDYCLLKGMRPSLQMEQTASTTFSVDTTLPTTQDTVYDAEPVVADVADSSSNNCSEISPVDPSSRHEDARLANAKNLASEGSVLANYPELSPADPSSSHGDARSDSANNLALEDSVLTNCLETPPADPSSRREDPPSENANNLAPEGSVLAHDSESSPDEPSSSHGDVRSVDTNHPAPEDSNKNPLRPHLGETDEDLNIHAERTDHIYSKILSWIAGFFCSWLCIS